MRRDLAALAVVLLSVARAGVARAGEKIAIVDVVVTGVTAEDTERRFEASFEEGLGGAGFEVVPRERVLVALASKDVPEGCSFGPCLAAVGRALGLRLAVAARVTAQGESYAYVLTMVDTRSGSPIRQVAENCPVCTIDEALAGATLAVVTLGTGLGRLDEPKPAPAKPRPVDRTGRKIRTAGKWTLGVGLAVLLGGVALMAGGIDEVGIAGIAAGGGVGTTGVVFMALPPDEPAP